MEPKDKSLYLGGENYGWGATFPALLLRNLVGFRELAGYSDRFVLAPSLPEGLMQPGKAYGVTNLNFRGHQFALNYRVGKTRKMQIELTGRLAKPAQVRVQDSAGKLLALQEQADKRVKLVFPGQNGAIYQVEIG